MYRKRPFATHGQGRRPARAAVCRIPCLILCLADVEMMGRGPGRLITDGPQRLPRCAGPDAAGQSRVSAPQSFRVVGQQFPCACVHYGVDPCVR